ncbi:hypothetical protein Tco_1522339 [Tanacetum coccineum]
MIHAHPLFKKCEKFDSCASIGYYSKSSCQMDIEGDEIPISFHRLLARNSLGVLIAWSSNSDGPAGVSLSPFFVILVMEVSFNACEESFGIDGSVIITTDWNDKDMDNIHSCSPCFYLASSDVDVPFQLPFGLPLFQYDVYFCYARRQACRGVFLWAFLWEANLLSIGGRICSYQVLVLGSL